ncbi:MULTISPECIES: DUF3311 domain-containing protein [unclassified Bacillus (in: firmicutes)]|uniref:DUF3311 domain-containing protein n=1 Tax=Bacillaceae TaxID=186817 RepID=UPI000BF08663|nr:MULTISPECIES: DUF3311 domain-containing protein [unclassified Bacillus (in: firmicutes)]PEJ60581.1 hypothetical protein CN692_00385 [Bacillus sp. AFS002410]PEL09908.1 hypothetical protein CN601_15320 [Bacillus sp. AFS017336]QKE73698.1 DUF3311 domain-containing protein [Arthrobacter citreus]
MKLFAIFLTIFAFIGSLTIVNRVEPYILGLPFIVFWSASWLVITSICLFISNAILEKQEENQ